MSVKTINSILQLHFQGANELMLFSNISSIDP